MDMKHADDIYDSFRSYQNRLLREYAAMADEFNFSVVDARRRVETIQADLRRRLEVFLAPSA
jgi:thymidylate kinase